MPFKNDDKQFSILKREEKESAKIFCEVNVKSELVKSQRTICIEALDNFLDNLFQNRLMDIQEDDKPAYYESQIKLCIEGMKSEKGQKLNSIEFARAVEFVDKHFELLNNQSIPNSNKYIHIFFPLIELFLRSVNSTAIKLGIKFLTHFFTVEPKVRDGIVVKLAETFLLKTKSFSSDLLLHSTILATIRTSIFKLEEVFLAHPRGISYIKIAMCKMNPEDLDSAARYLIEWLSKIPKYNYTVTKDEISYWIHLQTVIGGCSPEIYLKIFTTLNKISVKSIQDKKTLEQVQNVYYEIFERRLNPNKFEIVEVKENRQILLDFFSCLNELSLKHIKRLHSSVMNLLTWISMEEIFTGNGPLIPFYFQCIELILKGANPDGPAPKGRSKREAHSPALSFDLVTNGAMLNLIINFTLVGISKIKVREVEGIDPSLICFDKLLVKIEEARKGFNFRLNSNIFLFEFVKAHGLNKSEFSKLTLKKKAEEVLESMTANPLMIRPFKERKDGLPIGFFKEIVAEGLEMVCANNTPQEDKRILFRNLLEIVGLLIDSNESVKSKFKYLSLMFTPLPYFDLETPSIKEDANLLKDLFQRPIRVLSENNSSDSDSDSEIDNPDFLYWAYAYSLEKFLDAPFPHGKERKNERFEVKWKGLRLLCAKMIEENSKDALNHMFEVLENKNHHVFIDKYDCLVNELYKPLFCALRNFNDPGAGYFVFIDWLDKLYRDPVKHPEIKNPVYQRKMGEVSIFKRDEEKRAQREFMSEILETYVILFEKCSVIEPKQHACNGKSFLERVLIICQSKSLDIIESADVISLKNFFDLVYGFINKNNLYKDNKNKIISLNLEFRKVLGRAPFISIEDQKMNEEVYAKLNKMIEHVSH